MNKDQRTAEILRLTLNLQSRMISYFNATSDSLGLASIEARAILALDVPQPMGGIATALRCDASYVTAITDRLQNAGLVERRADPADRRVTRLALTESGERARHDLQSRLVASSPTVEGLTDEQAADLLELLRALEAAADGDRDDERQGQKR